MDQFDLNWLSVEFASAAEEIEGWNEGLKASFESIVAQAETASDEARAQQFDNQ
jgi:hypothetical protein